MKTELLPIGSVVQTCNSPSEVIVIGHYPIDQISGKTFEYLGANFPFGLGMHMDAILFQHNSIDKVLYRGYADDAAESYYKALPELIKMVKGADAV